MTAVKLFRSIGCLSKKSFSRDIVTGVPFLLHRKKGEGLHLKITEALNHQIQKEFTAFYTYVALESFFESKKWGLFGFAKHQRRQQQEELSHARELTKLMTIRGGQLKLGPIEVPQNQEWSSPLEAVTSALDLENSTALGLHELLDMAESYKDVHISHTIQSNILEGQMKCIYETQRLLAKMENCNSTEGLLMIDQSLME